MGKCLLELVKSTGERFSFEPHLPSCEVVIDFSSAKITPAVVEEARIHGKPLVLGTTGLSPEQLHHLRDAACDIPILYAPNFSLGMAALLKGVHLIASLLGDEAKIDIIDVHHAQKRDRPSGSALALAAAVSPKGAEVHSLRTGDVVGDHTVFITLKGERLELTHRAHSRAAFAEGALKAAEFLLGKTAGLYTIQDLFYGAHSS
jgi:4-hydroxy-tetrahydrodipicolinate reductase